jgi:hypothetical protein
MKHDPVSGHVQRAAGRREHLGPPDGVGEPLPRQPPAVRRLQLQQHVPVVVRPGAAQRELGAGAGMRQPVRVPDPVGRAGVVRVSHTGTTVIRFIRPTLPAGRGVRMSPR